MKLTKATLLAISLAAISPAVSRLAAQTAVLAAPAEGAAIIATLPAGTQPAPAKADNVPAGWTAVSLPGPHTVYVSDQDVLKNFDVKPGSSYRLAPEAGAAVLGQATAEDQVEITGLSGRWLQLNLKSPVTGYVRAGSVSTATTKPTPAPEPETLAPAGSLDPLLAPLPDAPAAAATATPGRAVAPAGALLPRMFQGTLASSRSAFRPRRPYDYQINDSRGDRYAYLDISSLLLTEQIDSYLGRNVQIYGTATNLPNSKEVVIKVETLKLP